MSEIPEDVKREARAVASDIASPDLPYDSDIEVVARAILAERERCAKIAENYGGGDYWGSAIPIAAAIRAQGEGK